MDYREIELSQGLVTKVSPEDYTYLSQWSWSFSCESKTDPNYGSLKRSIRKSDPKGLSRSMGRMLMNTPKGMEIDHINGGLPGQSQEQSTQCHACPEQEEPSWLGQKWT